MTAAQKLAENRRKQRELVARHQEIGRKFQVFAAPHRKACDEKLRREAFGPFVAVERAHGKAQVAQAAVAKELEVLHKEHDALLLELDREDSQQSGAPAPPVELDLDPATSAPAASAGPEADPIPELEL